MGQEMWIKCPKIFVCVWLGIIDTEKGRNAQSPGRGTHSSLMIKRIALKRNFWTTKDENPCV